MVYCCHLPRDKFMPNIVSMVAKFLLMFAPSVVHLEIQVPFFVLFV